MYISLIGKFVVKNLERSNAQKATHPHLSDTGSAITKKLTSITGCYMGKYTVVHHTIFL